MCKALRASTDLGAAVIVVELEVGEAGPLALLERRRPGVERHAVQAIVDLARFRRRSLRLPRPPSRIEPAPPSNKTSALSSPVGRPTTP